ncbi:lysozyme inhibitor LprI family protein [Burkholderia sp. Ax-1719]|uniref:lysozyme inhibitor LprI family protein n=1 Tax=Burkholderia sp. Ax-1719 TaxID=2608334 RepID=UPI00141FFF55|nr:lysozyme inhibitor LprI family protein [Burkholderia sp. Ax-1719]
MAVRGASGSATRRVRWRRVRIPDRRPLTVGTKAKSRLPARVGGFLLVARLTQSSIDKPSMKITTTLALVPLALVMSAANAASFDCSQAKTPVEHAICSDPKLSASDTQLQSAYEAAVAAMPAEARPAIRAGQRDWLGYRNACAQPTQGYSLQRCLTERIDARIQTLQDDAGKRKSYATIQAITSFIPEQPATAAQMLRQYPDNALGQAWLAYIGLHYPAGGVTAKEVSSALRHAEAGVDSTDHDDQAWTEYTDKKQPRATAVYYLLRLLMRENPDPGLITCAHAFIFRNDLKNASAAFGGINGSTRDAGAPYCEPLNGLFWLTSWRTMDSAFSGPIDLALEHAGTMSRGVLANMKLDAVHMSIAPQSYGTATNIAKIDAAVQTMKQWHEEPAWSRADRDKAIATIPAAIRETKNWAIRNYGLAPDDAQRAAQGIVGVYLESWIRFIRDPEDG